MLQRLRRRRAEPLVAEPDPPHRIVLVTYMTSAGLGACHLRDPRWCYRDGRLAFIGHHRRGFEIVFDFDQILTLDSAIW